MAANHDTAPSVRGEDRRRAASSVEARIEAALTSLLISGERYSALNVERILSVAGVARSTFYAYFDDKHHVLRVVGRDAVDRLVASAQGWRGIDEHASRTELRQVLGRLTATYRENSAVLAALTETGATDRTVRREVRRMSSPSMPASSRRPARSGLTSTPTSPSTGSWPCSRAGCTATCGGRVTTRSTRTSMS